MRVSNTYISEAYEIDLYECLKYDKIRSGGKVRTHDPFGPFYIPLARTRVCYGYRLWFLCGCNRRVTKMYVYRSSIACRHCLGLKYETQYDKRPIVEYEATIRRLLRYEKQNRRAIHGGNRPTQFGWRMIELLDKLERYENKYGFNQEREFDRIRSDIEVTTNRVSVALSA